MAIVDMKRFSLVALERDGEKLLVALQRLGCVQVVRHDDEQLAEHMREDAARREQCEAQLERLHWAIGEISRYEPKPKGFYVPRPTADEAAVRDALARAGQAQRAVDALTDIERRMGELRGRETAARAQLEQLAPYVSLAAPLSMNADTAHVRVTLGTVPSRAADGFYERIAALDAPIAAHELSRDTEGSHVLAVCHISAQAEWDALVKEFGFARAQLPSVPRSAQQLSDELRLELARMDAQRETLAGEVRALVPELGLLRLRYDLIGMERDRLSAAANFARTRCALLATGWLPASSEHKVVEQLRAQSPTCAIEIRDPTPEEQPPVLLQNNRFASPFESILKMYALPDPRGYDPCFIMAPFFICFFGMMVSDAGYGIILGLGAALMMKIMRPRGNLAKMVAIIAMGGVSTLLWGAAFGGWFGVELKPLLFSPMGEPMAMMGLCLGLGFVHILTGLGVAAYMNFKRHRPLDAVFDQFTWAALLLGLPMMLLPQTALLGRVLAIAGGGGIVVMGGRNSPTAMGKALGGLGKLYGISGYLSDILSYSRLFGMGLATGVIGMVLNTVAGMLWGNPIGMVFAIAILVGGHAFNLGINTLGAYVHACRLQYIEFFGKFLEDGGVEFAPLAAQPRYVDITEPAAIQSMPDASGVSGIPEGNTVRYRAQPNIQEADV